MPWCDSSGEPKRQQKALLFLLTNAEGRHVHSFTLNCKVKERESPQSGVFYFQSDRDSVSFRDRRERIIHFLRHCEIKSEVWQSGTFI